MSVSQIVAQIDAEIARLTQARALIAGLGSSSHVIVKTLTPPVKARKRVLGPEARKRIADAQHKRWAAFKAKSKSKSRG